MIFEICGNQLQNGYQVLGTFQYRGYRNNRPPLNKRPMALFRRFSELISAPMEFSESENLKKNKRPPFARRRRKILAIYGHIKGKFTSFFIKISAPQDW